MYQRADQGPGLAAGSAVLAMDQAVVAPPAPPRTGRSFINAFRQWVEETDFVVDLGSRIGSTEWCRGAAICFGLCAAAISLAPDLGPLPGGRTAPLPEAQWQEARAIGISALAFGADTGRRMAPTKHVVPLRNTPERPRIEISTTVGRGDGFNRALQRAGVSAGDAQRVSALVAQAVPLNSIQAGTRLDLVLGRRPNKRDPRPIESLDFRARLELALSVVRSESGHLQLKRIPIAVDNTPLRIQGVVGQSLFRSARAAGAPAGAIQAYLRAIGEHVSVSKEVGANDRFDLVIAQRRAATGEVEIGDLLYAGLDKGKRKIQLVKWTAGGRSEWFDSTGMGKKRGAFQKPVAGRQTSGFGMRRHPLLRYSRLHKGVDYGAPTGTPIYAVSDGRVSFAGRSGGHGNHVKLAHPGGLATGYSHMSRIAVRSGERVRQGDVIGYVGSTGMSTGPHLHFEVYRNGSAVNPNSVSFINQTKLAGAELRNFKSALNRYLAVRPGVPAAAETQQADAAPADGAADEQLTTAKPAKNQTRG